MTLFETYLKLRYRGVYNEEKSSDGQFTGGYYTDVYMLDGKEYHVNFDNGVIDDIQTKHFYKDTSIIPEGRILPAGKCIISWPIYVTVTKNA